MARCLLALTRPRSSKIKLCRNSQADHVFCRRPIVPLAGVVGVEDEAPVPFCFHAGKVTELVKHVVPPVVEGFGAGIRRQRGSLDLESALQSEALAEAGRKNTVQKAQVPSASR